MLMTLALDTLKEIDGGKIQEALNLHLRRVSLDCKDRPADGTARTVTMTIKMVPDMDPDGSCDRCKMTVEFGSKIPGHRTRAIEIGLKANGTPVFNPDSPTNVDQSTFIGDDE